MRGVIVTAAHVVYAGPLKPPYDAWWSDRLGNDGHAKTDWVSNAIDVAIMVPEYKGPVSIKVGTATTQLYFFDYNFSNTEDAFTSVRRETKLVRRIGGRLILEISPSQGASGGCIYNSKHEAVGIVVWGLEMHDESWVGVGVEFPKEWRVYEEGNGLGSQRPAGTVPAQRRIQILEEGQG